MKQIEKIVKTTERKPWLGFLRATLVAVALMGSGMAFLYRDIKMISDERLKALQDCTEEREADKRELVEYLKEDIRRKNAGTKIMDSVKQNIK